MVNALQDIIEPLVQSIMLSILFVLEFVNHLEQERYSNK